MPAQYHSSKSGAGGKMRKVRIQNQAKQTRNALDDEDVVIGKATKNLGFSRFMVALNADKEVNARVHGKATAFIKLGDYVILAVDEISEKKHEYRIICPIADKDVKNFKTRISKRLLHSEEADEGGIIFEEKETKQGADEEIDFENI